MYDSRVMKRMLVVEDSETFAGMIAGMLRSLGCEVDIVTDIHKLSWELGRHAEVEFRYDLIFVDYNMQDGLTTLGLIRQLDTPKAFPLVLVSSAPSTEQLIEDMEATGVLMAMPKIRLCSIEVMQDTVDRALKIKEDRRRNANTVQKPGSLPESEGTAGGTVTGQYLSPW